MQIKEAKVFNFGKLQNRNFHFASGINVIYGANETGKTTLHTFLSAMLFGMDKGRGRAAAGDVYTRYEPWHAPAFYSGALRFETGGQPFYLERSFYHREKREILRNEADGEELSVAYGDLAILLGGIGKETFGNTYDVPQCGVSDGKELARILAEYLADASESGEAGIHVARALAELEDKRKRVQTEIKKMQEQKQRQVQSLKIEQEILERDCGLLRGEITGAEQETVEQYKSDSTDAEAANENAAERRPDAACSPCIATLAAVTLALIFVLNVAAFLKYDYSFVIFAATESATAIFFAGALLLRRRSISAQGCCKEGCGGKREEACEAGTGEDRIGEITEAGAEAEECPQEQCARANELLNHLREMLSEKETRLYHIMERMEELAGQNEQECELAGNIQALNLAESEIRRLAGEYREELSDILNEEISRLLSEITQGAYDSVRVDADGTLKIFADGREIAPEALSRGTLEQCYLAFRIAVGNIVTGEEPMPLLLDETFCMYDDGRLMQALSALSKMKRQVLLFTCQRREQELLERSGFTYHMIEME